MYSFSQLKLTSMIKSNIIPAADIIAASIPALVPLIFSDEHIFFMAKAEANAAAVLAAAKIINREKWW